MVVVVVVLPQVKRDVWFDFMNRLGHSSFRLRVRIVEVRGEIEILCLDTIPLRDLDRRVDKCFLSAFGWWPIRIVADQDELNDAVVLGDGFQHDAGNAINTIIVMCSDCQERFLIGHCSFPH